MNQQVTPPNNHNEQNLKNLRLGNQKSHKKRDPLIDTLKGYAIFLVVWGHTIQFFGEGLELMNQNIGKYIYIFHMPLFFFMSSLVGTRSITMPFKEMIMKKFKTLIIPLICFSVLQFIICLFFDTLNGASLTPYTLIREFLYKIVGSYWFIIILTCFFILSNIANKLSKDDRVFTLITMLLLWILTFLLPRPMLPFNLYITYLQGMFPFFILGWIFYKFNLISTIKKYSFPIFLISSALLILIITYTIKDDFIYFQNYDIWFKKKSLLNVVKAEGWLVIGGIVGIIATFSSFSLLKHTRIIDYIRPVGKQTLGIYLIQGVIFNSILIYHCPQLYNDILYFIIAIGITSISYFSCIVLDKTKFGRISLGKS